MNLHQFLERLQPSRVDVIDASRVFTLSRLP
jgi:hypothetical protein